MIGFLRDEQGLYMLSMRLILAIVLAAAVLAILATILPPLDEGVRTASSNITYARKIAVKRSIDTLNN